MAADLSSIKAYDIRGIYPDQIDEDFAYRLGHAYAKVIKPEGKIAVGYDVRIHSKSMKEALVKGLRDAGLDIVDVGLISTEMIYFAVGYYNLAGGIQVTASHNPKEYSGFKMVREKAIPISSETGLFEMRDLIANEEEKVNSEEMGSLETKDIMDDFVNFCLDFVKIENPKSLKIVHNPNFGFEGEVLKRVVELGNLPLELSGLNDTPDGNFPKGRPDPFRLENRPEFVEKVLSEKADLGVAWDADADRVFFCTPNGIFLEPYFANALLIKYMLKEEKNGKVIYDPRYNWALIDATNEAGGVAILERVGHSFIKARMKKEDAAFSGEASGHTYFRDFWYADSGILPFLIMVKILSETDESLDDLIRPYLDKYFISGEINNEVSNALEVVAKVKEKYADADISEIDGLSIEYRDWRANIRSSNTEPLLRLNVEAKNNDLMEEKRDELISLINSVKK